MVAEGAVLSSNRNAERHPVASVECDKSRACCFLPTLASLEHHMSKEYASYLANYMRANDSHAIAK
jgi:hypothetical protein